MSSQKLVHSISANLVSTKDLNVFGAWVLKGINVVSPTTETYLIVNAAPPGVIIAPTSPLQEVVVKFPQNCADSTIIFVSFTQDVQNVVFSDGKFANKASIGPFVTAGDSITLFYNKSSNKWFKLSGSSSIRVQWKSRQ
ncbi:hypothetical protein BDK51DRAFT_34353 [Blyttiomyces helicus]|uniref:Uncharacterized protein n=1 Tax=Blyttiomyces helicus TaxID=388810 RepID=A0A4P9WSB6_9FUNG|nr:hypothetical protein BDK51DRAFT_34353 [Blyttiomyces helicus]|eukprot:RKO94848.1 hypothetical protein BDK51DRAFT_34353 [Blyttiomyces helicus]